MIAIAGPKAEPTDSRPWEVLLDQLEAIGMPQRRPRNRAASQAEDV